MWISLMTVPRVGLPEGDSRCASCARAGQSRAGQLGESSVCERRKEARPHNDTLVIDAIGIAADDRERGRG